MWKSFDKVRQEVVAVKVMDLTKKSGAREKCDTEDRHWKSFQHANIVQWRRSHLRLNMRITAMQYCNGGDLFDVGDRKFDEAETLHVVAGVLRALDYLHTTAHVIHRDVKKENILLHFESEEEEEEDNAAKQRHRQLVKAKILLTDFTFVGPVSETRPYDTTFTDFCGTPHYVAPEVWSMQPYTAKVDCWAVGILAFELLENALPYDPAPNLNVNRVFRERKSITQPIADSTLAAISALLLRNANRRASAREALDILDENAK